MDHVQLAMPRGGEAAARRFYGGVLGLIELPKPPDLAARGGCWFQFCPLQLHLGVEADKVTEDASFIDDLGADSLDIVELVMAFEEEFGVEIPDDAAEKITTVRDAIEYIDQNKG